MRTKRDCGRVEARPRDLAQLPAGVYAMCVSPHFPMHARAGRKLRPAPGVGASSFPAVRPVRSLRGVLDSRVAARPDRGGFAVARSAFCAKAPGLPGVVWGETFASCPYLCPCSHANRTTLRHTQGLQRRLAKAPPGRPAWRSTPPRHHLMSSPKLQRQRGRSVAWSGQIEFLFCS